MFNCEYLSKRKNEERQICICTNKGCRFTRLQGLCKLGIIDFEEIQGIKTAPLRKKHKKYF